MEKSDPKRGATPVYGPTPGNKTASGRPDGSIRAPHTRPWLLRKRGSQETLRCPDLATLRTWMIERRISRDDEISRGGKVFRRLGNIVEFESLFHSAEVERAEKRRGPRATGSENTAPAAASPPAKADAGPKRGELSAPQQVRVAPPGLTPTTGNMNPLRLTPSGQPNRPRPPVPAVPIIQVPEAPTAASATSSPPASDGGLTAGGKPTDAETQPKPTAGPTSTDRPASGKPATAGSPAAGPGKGAAGPAAAKPPSSGGTASASKGPAVKTPPAAAAAGIEEEGDDTVVDATKRFVRVESPSSGGKSPVANAPKPAAPGPVPSAAQLGSPKDSGNDTIAFRRTAPEDVETPTEIRLPAPATSDPVTVGSDDTTDPRHSAKPIDPIEEALRKSDPVPRHMKEAADPNRTSRIATTDPTERIEGTEGRRGALLFGLSIALTAALIFGLQQVGQQSTDGERGDSGTQQTAQRPENNTPSGVAGTEVQKPSPSGSEPAGAPEVGTPTTTQEPTGKGTGTTPPAARAVTGTTTPAKPQASPSAAGSGAVSTTSPAQSPTSAGETTTKPAANPAATAASPSTAAAIATAAAPTKAPATAPTAAAAGTSPTPAKPPAPTPAPTKPATAAAPTGGGKKIVVTEVPKTFDEQMDLAQRLVEREQFDEAQRLFETIMSYASHVPAVHVGLGKCALETGRTAEAIQHYNNALSKAPNYGPAIFGLAKTYRAKGDKDQALQHYRKYVELYPNSGAAQVARDTIARLEGRTPTPAPSPGASPTPAPSSSELVKPPSGRTGSSSELVKPQ